MDSSLAYSINKRTKEMNLPPIFVLCNPLQESVRYTLLQEQFQKIGIDPDKHVEYVHGTWGSDLTSEEAFAVWDPYQKRFGLDKLINFKGTALTKGELSLNTAFAKVVQKGLASNAECILVFESDIVLRSDFLQRFQEVMACANGMTWDYISLGEGVNTRPPGREWTSYFAPTAVCEPPKHPWVFRCCDSMVLHRRFLEKLAVTFLPFREALDWELNVQLLLHKGKALWVDPPLVEAGSGRNRALTSLPS